MIVSTAFSLQNTMLKLFCASKSRQEATGGDEMKQSLPFSPHSILRGKSKIPQAFPDSLPMTLGPGSPFPGCGGYLSEEPQLQQASAPPALPLLLCAQLPGRQSPTHQKHV